MPLFTGSNSMNWKWELDNNTFDIVNVKQFKNHHFSTIMALILGILQIALALILYALDCYTCVRLLAYNSWGSEIEPAIPFSISRWIFSGCIVISVVLLLYDFISGIQVYFTKNISLTYTNRVARCLWSMKGYSYFCLYDQITPKNFFDYCAFFIYFTLKGCLKLLLADSPRQVINGITIYSVIKNDSGKVLSSYQAFTKDGIKETWAIVFTIMGLSFLIWLIFIIKFFVALILATCVATKINSEGFNLKQFVCVRINEKVRELSSKYHKETLKQLRAQESKMSLKKSTTGTSYNTPSTFNNSSFRKSLRKSGNDLLPLNQSAAAPPPLPSHIDLSEKSSYSNLNNQIPQSSMSPIFGNNTGEYSSFNKPSLQRRNLTNQSSYYDNDFGTSSDNLLSNQPTMGTIPARKAMPKPHPLNGDMTGSSNNMSNNMTGGAMFNSTGGPMSNNMTGISQLRNGGPTPYSKSTTPYDNDSTTVYNSTRINSPQRANTETSSPYPTNGPFMTNVFATPPTSANVTPQYTASSNDNPFNTDYVSNPSSKSTPYPVNPYIGQTNLQEVRGYGGLPSEIVDSSPSTVQTATLQSQHTAPYPTAGDFFSPESNDSTSRFIPSGSNPYGNILPNNTGSYYNSPNNDDNRRRVLGNLYDESDLGHEAVNNSPVLQTYKDMGVDNYKRV